MNAPARQARTLEESMRRGRAEVSAARHVPFSAPASDSVLRLRKSGDLCCTWRVAGVPFVTADPAEILADKEALINFIHSVRGTERGEPCAIWVHRIRRKATEHLQGHYANPFAATVDEKYWGKLSAKSMLRSELYFTLLLRPEHSLGGKLLSLGFRSKGAKRDLRREVLGRFEELAQRVDSGLARYGAARLRCYEGDGPRAGTKGPVSPALSFYSWLLGGVRENVTLQPGSINHYLSAARVFAADTSGIIEMAHPTRTTYAGYLDLQDYPAVTEPGLNNCLFDGDYEFVETQSFSFIPKRDGIDALDLHRRRASGTNESSEEQSRDIDQAIEDARNGRIYMGEYHYSLGLRGTSIEDVRANMAKARNALEEQAGYRVLTSDLIPECAHFAQLPGAWSYRPRSARITTRNLASLAPLHNFELGKRSGNPWGEAVTMFETPNSQGFYFNFHEMLLGKDRFGEMDAGDTFITGKVGTGKSATMAFLLCQALKFPGLRILCLDKDRSNEIIIRRLGGKYRQLKRGEPTGFNPFQWEPTVATIKWVKKLVRSAATRGEEELTPGLENKLNLAVDRVFALPKPSRRISAILQFVGEDSELGQRLAKWCRTSSKTGENAWVFDNASDTTSFEGYSIFGFDYSDSIDDPECGPFLLAYILQSANVLIDGQPFIYVLEEFAKMVAAKTQLMAEFARDQATTIRKKAGLGIFVTQSPSQVKAHAIGVTLREQCTTKIYLPNPGALHEDYPDLSDTEFAILKALAPDSRMFLVKQGFRSSVCKLDLGHMGDELLALSGSLERAKLLDIVRAEVGSDDPEVWWRPFVERCRATTDERRLLAPTSHDHEAAGA